MSTSWTLTRERIADKALEKCNVLGVGRVANEEDRSLAMEAMDGILKELPTHGVEWPKVIDSQANIALLADTSPTALPTDYYGGLVVNVVGADGNESELELVSLSEWNAIPDKDYASGYPSKGYIDQQNNLHTWPVQNQAVTLKAYYTKVADDTVDGQAPDITQPFILGFVYGIAAEIGDEFGVKSEKIMRFEAKWNAALMRMKRTTAKHADFKLEVDE